MFLSPFGQITYFSSTQTVVQSSGNLDKHIFSHATVGAVGTSHSSFSIDYTMGANVAVADCHLPFVLHRWTFLPLVHKLL